MKRVGIITMHRVQNCGSVLQAYALQKYIKDIGYECEIIDYIYPNKYHFCNRFLHKQTYPVFLKLFFIHLKRFIKFVLFLDIKIDTFRRNYLVLSKERFKNKESIMTTNFDYDVFVSGSDQIWNPKHVYNDETFMLSFVKDNKKRISYASSISTAFITDDYRKLLSKNLNKYDFLGVRESNSKNIIEEIINKNVVVNCDPVFLVNKNQWRKMVEYNRIMPIERPYVLFYILTYAYDPYPELNFLIERIVNLTGLYPIIVYGKKTNDLHINYSRVRRLGPFEFISLIDNASLVITTSFHGTCFSLMFEKDFYSLVENDKPNVDNRIFSLLERIGLSDRILFHSSKYGFECLNKIQYDTVNINLEEYRNESCQYLEKALS